ncbi:EamA family transporter [Nanohaloarchaea archaeon]|nr:EamA family transporter [Candidatus Nanohaloarchaea archaeon]
MREKNALETDEFVTAWSSRVFGIPVLLAAMMYTGLSEVTLSFFLLVVPQSLVIALTSILIAKAYKESDASIVTPIFAISPMLVLGTSFLMLGETPSVLGAVGVSLVALGAYVLKSGFEGDLLEPLRRLWDERGVQIILIVILIYSITANLDKIGVNMSSPILWPLTVYTLSSLFMFPVMVRNSGD